MKTRIIFFLFFLPVIVFAQRPNMDSLKTLLFDERELEAYNDLLGRYLALDTTLNQEEFYLLYYGFVSHPLYAPNRKIEEEDDFVDLVNQASYADASKLGKMLFQHDPFNIDLLFGMVICTDTMERKNWLFHYRKVCEAIFLSGDGLTEESAWVVISVQNEYALLEAMGLTAISLEELSDQMDKFILNYPNEFGITEVYFDHSEAFLHYLQRK